MITAQQLFDSWWETNKDKVDNEGPVFYPGSTFYQKAFLEAFDLATGLMIEHVIHEHNNHIIKDYGFGEVPKAFGVFRQKINEFRNALLGRKAPVD